MRRQFIDVRKRSNLWPNTELYIVLYIQACQSLAMHSFLMLPMQRITRLPLLTDAIICRLPTDSSEIEAARSASHQRHLAELSKICHVVPQPFCFEFIIKNVSLWVLFSHWHNHIMWGKLKNLEMLQAKKVMVWSIF